MKIALCLYGYFNNKADSSAGMKGYEYIKEHILKYENVDVFVHSWDLENSQKILDLYKPVEFTFDEQVDFDKRAKIHGVYQDLIDENFDRASTIYNGCTIQASLSFFESRAMSLGNKSFHEIQNGFRYDVVITARFDLGHRSGFHRRYNVSHINFDPTLDMNYLYSSMWMQLNAGYADQWFYSNSWNMDLFMLMGSHFLKDSLLFSDYHKALTNGWFDSNADDEFSNERLKTEKTNNLMKYPTWQMINNHLYHKWFLKNVGLYDKSKFL